MNTASKICLTITILFVSNLAFGQFEGHKDVKIKSYLDSLNDDNFSGTILVAHHDKVIEKRAYGLASIEYGAKNKVDTKFNIASITKMITSVATLQLYDRGLIELKQPIGKYLPDYPNKLVKDSVTVHQLLTHTAGQNNFYVVNFLQTEKLQYKNVSDFVPLFADSLLSHPGTKYDYSGSGFVILGLIIEAVSGQNYYDYMTENIFVPAGMVNTEALEIDAVVQNKASGYTTFFGQHETPKRNDYYISKASPGGNYYSTVEDLFRFSKALRNGTLLKKETVELMFAPKVKGYNTHLGYGIDVDLRYSQPIIGHSGGWYGVRAELMDFMEDKYTIVVLSNIDDGGKTGASKVIDFFKELIAGKRSDKILPSVKQE